MSMHGEKEKRKRKEKGHLAFQVPFLHVLAQSHESGTNGELTVMRMPACGTTLTEPA